MGLQLIHSEHTHFIVDKDRDALLDIVEHEMMYQTAELACSRLVKADGPDPVFEGNPRRQISVNFFRDQFERAFESSETHMLEVCPVHQYQDNPACSVLNLAGPGTGVRQSCDNIREGNNPRLNK